MLHKLPDPSLHVWAIPITWLSSSHLVNQVERELIFFTGEVGHFEME